MNDSRPRSLAELLVQLNAEGITDHRRYEIVRRYLDFKARDRAVPLSGTFELTPLCNLDCKMCYVHLQKEQMAGAQLMSVNRWKDIMQQAIDAGMMYARLTGGECLTYPGFRELYLFLHKRGVEVTVLSNGLLLDEELVAFFLAHPPAAIQVSLYGVSDEAYERVTGQRAFGCVDEHLRRIREAGLPLQVAVTPSEYMADGPEIVRYLHERDYIYQINAGLMAPRVDTGRTLADVGLDSYVEMMKLCRRLRGNGEKRSCDPEALPDAGGGTNEAARGVRCAAGRSCFSIDWKGGMRPCNTFPCEPQDVAALGFAEAWKRTNQTATQYLLPAECEGCPYAEVCKHCVGEHAAGARMGHANPAVCGWVKRMIAEGLLSQQRLSNKYKSFKEE